MIKYDGTRNGEKKVKKKVLISFIVMMGLILTGCGNKLSGAYTGKVTLLFVQQKDTMIFDGDKVTEKQNDKITNKGTYKIDGDDLTININGYHMRAKLSDNRKSFTITSADGIANLVKGTTYTKKE